MIFVEGEWLEGYHFESIPQFGNNQFDRNALSAIAGMRAVWLLYLLGRWDYLEDLGVDRETTEPVLQRFQFGPRLTPRQAQQLRKAAPSLAEASVELRLSYALKHREDIMSDQMVIYHAEVPSSKEADEAVKRHTPEIQAAGGEMQAAHNLGRGGSIVMVKLPARLNVEPANVLPGSGLKFSKMRAQVVRVPKPTEETNG